MSKMMMLSSTKGSENAVEDSAKMMMMVPALKFSQQEQQFVLRSFMTGGERETDDDDDKKFSENNSIAKARQQYISKEHEKHLPLLKKLLSGDMKPFTKQEAAALMTTQKSSSSGELMMNSNNSNNDDDDDADEFVTNLLSLVSSSSYDVSLATNKNDENLEKNTSDDSHNQSNIPTKIVDEREFVNFVQQQSNAGFDPDFQTNSAMASYVTMEQQKNQRQRFYEMKKATAWMNPDSEKV